MKFIDLFDLQTLLVLIKKLVQWLELKYTQLKLYQKLNERKELNGQLNLKSLIHQFNYPQLLKNLKPITTLRNLWKPVQPPVQRPLIRLTNYTNTPNNNYTMVTNISKNNNKYTKTVYAYVKQLLVTAITSVEPGNKRIEFNPELQLS